MTDGDHGALDFNFDLVGQTLDGRWCIESELGKGGMGTVYRATDVRLSRTVVLKVPHPKFLAEEGFRARFDREIRSLLTLEHPHIVKVHDVGAYRGVPFAVLQFLPGGSLADRMTAVAGPLTPEQVLAWLPSIAEALDFVHARGVVHRDVKPGNVLFDEAGHAFLADFGIAKALGGVDTGLTQTGMTPGSPNYMSPETVVGSAAGPKADQYALGSLVYEALSARLPFPGGTAIEILVAKQMAAAPALDIPTLPPAASSAVMRALERDPAARFPSCAAFAAAFAKGLSAPHATHAAAPPRPTLPHVPTPHPMPAPAPVLAPGSGSVPRRGRGLLATVVILLALAGAAFAAWGVGFFDNDRRANPTLPALVKPDVPRYSPLPPPNLAAPMDPEPVTPEAPTMAEPPPMAETPPVHVRPKPALPFVLSVDLPAESAWLKARRVTVSGTVTAADGVEVRVDGEAATVRDGRFSVSVDIGEGLHEFTIHALDGAGRTASATRTVTVDSTPPTIEDVDPASGAFVAAKEVLLKLRSEAGAAVTMGGVTAKEGDPGTFTATVPLPIEGGNRIAIAATDPAGNASAAEVTIRRDMVPPVVHVTLPARGLYVKVLSCVLEGASEDARTFTVGDVVPEVASDGRWKVTVPLTKEGENEISYSATDRAGNVTKGSVTVVCDMTVPVLTLEEPAAGAEVPDGPIRVRGQVADASPGIVRVNGAEVPYADGRFDGRAAVNPQARSLRFEAIDAAGNASEVKFVTIVRTGASKVRFPGLTARPGATGALVEFTLDKDPSVVLVLVPAGDFVAGPAKDDPSAKADEGKPRKVKVQTFLVAKTEVTWEQWEKFRAATNRAGPMLPGDEPRQTPAHGLTWADAKAWCDWAGLRLPTEDEWERAARGGVEGALFWWGGDTPPKKRVGNLSDESRKRKTKADLGGEYWFRYDDGFAGLAPVASFAANGFGLFDVTGNVWEWCAEPYNPREASGSRVLRGGGFDSRRSDCRVSRRNPQAPDFHSDSTGFRPAGG